MSLTGYLREYFVTYDGTYSNNITKQGCEDHTGSALTLIKMEGVKYRSDSNDNIITVKREGVSRLGRGIACFFLIISHIIESVAYLLVDVPLTLMKKFGAFVIERAYDTNTPQESLNHLNHEMHSLGDRIANLGIDFIEIVSYPFQKNHY